MPAAKKVSADQVREALAARPGVTAAELAEALGLGQSTAAKHLAALEAQGVARRDPGGREGARRLPDRWHVNVPEPEPAPAGSGRSGPAGQRRQLGGEGTPGTAGRLGRGELGALVADYLADRPTEAVGATEVAKALGGRSSGAVANALQRLCDAGAAALVSTSPRRYRLAADR